MTVLIFCAAVVFLQLAGAYLRFLAFRDQMNEGEVWSLWRKFVTWSGVSLFIYWGLFWSTGLVTGTYKAVLMLGWIPYMIIFVRALPGRLLSHVFVLGMVALWSFITHNWSNIAVTVFMSNEAEQTIIFIHPLLYLMWFVLLLPIEWRFFSRVLPDQAFLLHQPVGIYIALLPIIMLSGHIVLIADGQLWHTWAERISRLCLLIGFVFAYRYIIVAARRFYDREMDRHNGEIMEREIVYLEEYQKLIQDNKIQAEKMQENLLSRYETLQMLLNRGDVAAAKKFIAGQEQLLATVSIRSYCNSPIVNAAISLYLRRAEAQGITVRQKINLPKTLATDENDLAVLLSNLLENAIQACAGSPKPELSIVLQHNGRQCVLEIVNSCVKELRLGDDGLPETKHAQAGHGIGTLSLKNFLAKYDGYVDFSQERGQVRLFIYWEGGK
ncbi:GHKL domain-containing protein [Selenomonas ruminantium]|uniref:GHKL domain-containing protein n=1 Tax=Selenomonas ruminantium TaxID=971 RepID=A0A1M6V8K6_SELRU|nr:GHKL domain-containing protein [Selenomonas ruminantium]